MLQTTTILIVDDEPSGRDILAALLHGQDYELAFATNGLDALAQAAALCPDLILLDVMMPGMDGFEVCHRLRTTPAARSGTWPTRIASRSSARSPRRSASQEWTICLGVC